MLNKPEPVSPNIFTTNLVDLEEEYLSVFGIIILLQYESFSKMTKQLPSGMFLCYHSGA